MYNIHSSVQINLILLRSLSITYTANGQRQVQENEQKMADKKSSKQFLWIKNCLKLLIYVLK